MMHLASPWWLVLLVPVLLLPLQGRLTGRNRLAVGRIDEMRRGWTLRLLLAPLPTALGMAGLALVVVALARPQVSHREVIVESEGLDIVLSVDTSGSMKAEDFTRGLTPVNRLQVAKGVIGSFIEGRPHDRIGLVVFGEEGFTQVPLTLDHATLLDMLGQVEIGMAGPQGTAIGTGLAVAARRLQELESDSRLVILLTDGRNNAGRVSPMEAAQAAAALGIKVYTIGVGAERIGLVGDGLDEEGLTRIAEATGGRYFRATDSDSLQRIYETIDELEPSPAEVSEIVEEVELFRRFLAPGLLLLGLQVLLSQTLLRRGP